MSLVNCEKITVKNCDKGRGVFAKCDININTLVENGIMVPIDVNGNDNTHVFTWSDDQTVWAFGSGCSTFYNTSINPNCKMIRDFKNNTFEIISLTNIKKGEELTHLYRSLSWRPAFKELKNKLSIS